ncbi:MAG: division plane positioning ATPase MipZ [Ahrensia sp.]
MDLTSIDGRKLPEKRFDHAHVIVCGNEKGGSGKSTTAVHIAITLQKLGFRVATLDIDIRQRTLTRHMENRHRWVETHGEALEIPSHYTFVSKGAALDIENGADDGSRVLPIERQREEFDFIIVDTPGSYTNLSVMAHRCADTLVTPINDSFIDFDVLARVDGVTYEIEELSQYALEVRDARRYRQLQGNGILDWVVVRNRMSQISSRNELRVDRCVRDLSAKLGFRVASGIAERVVFREFFQAGLTALDEIVDTGEARRSSMSHLAARNEVRKLVASLHLPIDEAGQKRAAARQKWLQGARPAITLPDVFA